jgi:murein L,D-transpeptidase YcbB/YkuD
MAWTRVVAGVRFSALILASSLLVPARPAAAQAAADPAPVAAEIKWRVERIRELGAFQIGESRLSATPTLLDAYERRGFEPIWDSPAIDQLLAALRASANHGLEPAHYRVADILARVGAARSTAAASAELDLLASDALLRVAHDLAFGRVEPAGPTTGRDRPSPFGGSDAAADLVRVAGSGRVGETLSALPPSHFVYQGLVRALAQLRTVQEAGGWVTVPSGPLLRPDSVDARVPRLRLRLSQSGDLASAAAGVAQRASDDRTYDAELQAAVRKFQHRHGLNEDGVVGAATLAELNLPVRERITQVRVNLERARWVAQDLPASFVAVNVAGAKVYLLRDGQVAFETRAIVGKDYTRTPVFRADMRYIDLNPTWTVPPSIVGEIIAEVARDPAYLERQGIQILDGEGRTVDPASVDLVSYRGRAFPYVLRQQPGAFNPLGRIKLMFPNRYNVYLHDTPTRGLFAREERLFSHGCIRVEDPLTLAAMILNEPERWSREALQAAIENDPSTQTIQLARPLPVLILYWTASADFDGELHFYRDVYERDAELLAALSAP